MTLFASPLALAQSTAFTYQGRLTDGGDNAQGFFDLRFRLFDAPQGGANVGGMIATNGVLVTNGLFAVTLDFGAFPFEGAGRWLQIQAATNGAGQFATLSPRQPVTSAPQANYASRAGNVSDGVITAAKIASGQVVKSVNGLTDAISLVAGNNVTLTPNGNTLTIDANGDGAFSLNGTSAYYNRGRVGIGTSAPGHALDVAGEINAAGAFVTSAAYTGGYGTVLTVPHYFRQRLLSCYWNGEVGDYVDIEVPGNDGPGNLLRISSRGNVGIGTPSPEAPLHVVGPSSNFGLIGRASEGVYGVGHGNAAGVRGVQSPTGAYGGLGISLPQEGVVGVYGHQGFGDLAGAFRGKVAITNAQGGHALRIDSVGGSEALRVWARGAVGAKITSDYCTALQVEGGGACYALQVWALRTEAPVGKGLQVTGESDFHGNFTVFNGSKSAIVSTSQGQRKLYCEESSQVWFAEYGSGRLTNGTAVIRIDPLFAETVNLERPYHVFVQLNDTECESVAVIHRRSDRFEVRERRGGVSNAEFSYRLVALRRGFEDARLEPVPPP